MDSPDRFVEFTIRGLALDPESSVPILLLQDRGGRMILPIWIGAFEAGAIAMHLEGRRFPRPMTHDLLHAVVEALRARVVRLDIRALEQGTFLGSLVLVDADGREHVVDCRPSDGVALAVRADAPVRVAAAVLEAARLIPEEDQLAPDAGQPRTMILETEDDAARARLADQLADLAPEDFGKYRM